MGYSSVATSTVSVVHPQIPATIEWDKFDGAELSHTNQRFYTAPNVERVYGGKTVRDNITVEAFLDPEAYADFIEAGNSGQTFAGASIRVSSVDAAGSPIGKPDEYKNCVVARWTPRKVDLNGEEMQKIIVEWEVPAP